MVSFIANVQLHRYDSFFRFISLFASNINVKPGPAIVNNNKISLNILPFYNYDEPTMPFKGNKEHKDSKWNIFKKELVYFASEYQ